MNKTPPSPLFVEVKDAVHEVRRLLRKVEFERYNGFSILKVMSKISSSYSYKLKIEIYTEGVVECVIRLYDMVDDTEIKMGIVNHVTDGKKLEYNMYYDGDDYEKSNMSSIVTLQCDKYLSTEEEYFQESCISDLNLTFEEMQLLNNLLNDAIAIGEEFLNGSKNA